MSPTLPKFMVGLFTEYFEELGFLWGQRRRALDSPKRTLRELKDLEDRIEAHVDALVVAGEQVVSMAESALSADDPLAVFAAAYALLRQETVPAAQAVMQAFLQAKESQLDALSEALCQGPIDRVMVPLRQALASADPPIAAAAAEVLAFHGRLDPKEQRLVEFCGDASPQARRAAWRAIALVGAAPAASRPGGNSCA
jgi:uncharacterized protein (TIGR02270 family)